MPKGSSEVNKSKDKQCNGQNKKKKQ